MTPALTPTPTPADLPSVLRLIHSEAQALFGRGQVASHIPALAEVNPRQFGMDIAVVDGSTHAVGDTQVPFSPQNITKRFPFAFVLALQAEGDRVWQRVGSVLGAFALERLVQLTGCGYSAS